MSITSSLVWDSIQKQYVVVLDKRNLIIWDGTETNFNNIAPIILNMDVVDLLINENQEGQNECYLTFKSGSVHTISFIKNNPNYKDERLYIPENSSILMTKFLRYDNR